MVGNQKNNRQRQNNRLQSKIVDIGRKSFYKRFAIPLTTYGIGELALVVNERPIVLERESNKVLFIVKA